MTKKKYQHKKSLTDHDAAAPGDALGIEDMGGDNRSGFVQPRRDHGGVLAPAAYPKTKE